MEDPIYGFNEKDKDNILRMIGNSDTGGVTGGRGFNDYDATRLIIAIATTGVPARVGTTLGVADVAVKHLLTSGANKVVTDSAITMKAYNLAGDAVAAGAYIMALRFGDAAIVIWEEC